MTAWSNRPATFSLQPTTVSAVVCSNEVEILCYCTSVFLGYVYFTIHTSVDFHFVFCKENGNSYISSETFVTRYKIESILRKKMNHETNFGDCGGTQTPCKQQVVSKPRFILFPVMPRMLASERLHEELDDWFHDGSRNGSIFYSFYATNDVVTETNTGLECISGGGGGETWVCSSNEVIHVVLNYVQHISLSLVMVATTLKE